MTIIYTKEFIRLYKKLPARIKNLAVKKEQIFSINPYHPSLRTHKLTGHLEGCLSFYINYQYRILFRFGVDDIVYFIAVGGHGIYK